MKIVIWGLGRIERSIEDYIRKDVEIVAFVDNNKAYAAGRIEVAKKQIRIINPDCLQDLSFDYCLIAVKSYHAIIKQCLALKIPEEKIIQAADLSSWDMDLLECIFDKNVLADPRNYIIDNIRIDLGGGTCAACYSEIL